VRALGAPRAHVLHARALRRHAALPRSTRPDPGPFCTAEPRTSRPLLHDGSGTLLRRWPRPWRHAGVGSGFRRGRRRPNHQCTPAAPVNSSCLSPRSSARFRRRCDALQLQQRLSPTSLSSAATEPASSRYIKGPRAPPSTHATSDTPRRASRVVNRTVVAVSLNSGQPGRRQAPVRFVATGHPLAQPAPPVAPSGPCGAAQLLIFDQRPPEHKKHFTTAAFLRRGARRRRLLPPPPTHQPPRGPPRSCRSIPARRCPRGAAVRRRRSPEPRSRRAEEKRRREGTVKPDQWALWTHCQ